PYWRRWKNGWSASRRTARLASASSATSTLRASRPSRARSRARSRAVPSLSHHRFTRPQLRSVLLALAILGEVQRQDAGQDQQVVLVGRDVDSVGVAHAEPALGDGGHRLVAASDGVLVIEQVARHLHVVGPGNVDRELVNERREQTLAHLGDLVTRLRDLGGA